MFQGSIDFASRTRVLGWVYCTRWSLVGARVHAFVDDYCVGTGIVGLFRQDLVQAGIGDGLGGFDFSIALDPAHDPRTVHIRVEDGNALIRQPGTCLEPRAVIGIAQRWGARDLSALFWMRARGWLLPEQFEILRDLADFGVCRQRFEPAIDHAESAARERALNAAGPLLELLMFAAVTPACVTGLSVAQLPKLRQKLLASIPLADPIVGLWAQTKSSLRIIEGSHRGSATRELGAGIEYEFGDDTLLWAHLECQITAPLGGISTPLTAFFVNAPGSFAANAAARDPE
jgi:hypothetical protein